MQLAIRLWLALLVATCLTLFTGAYLRGAEERATLLELTLRDRRFFAWALHAAVSSNVSKEDPLAKARAVLDHEAIVGAHIDARLVSLEANGSFPKPRYPSAADAPKLRAGEVVVSLVDEEVVTYVPVTSGHRNVAIELVEPHAAGDLLDRLRWSTLYLQTGVLAAAVALITFLLTGALVGRPLAELTRFARRLKSGDLAARTVVRANDEIAVLGDEMNEMAESLQAARAALEDAGTERVSALQQLRHADRLVTVGQLASSLAHELGTPLNVVAGHARILERSAPDEDARESALTIHEQTRRMSVIVRGLLDLSRRVPSTFATHESSELVARAVKLLEPLASKHNVSLIVEPGLSLPIQADQQQVQQVLTNLIMNSVQALPAGGSVRVEVAEAEQTPPEGWSAEGRSFAKISVIDDGVGIPPEHLPRLFEPFFTSKAPGEGTGLGLSVVEGIVRDHHGWVQLTSTLGEGTRVDVFLPRSRARER